MQTDSDIRTRSKTQDSHSGAIVEIGRRDLVDVGGIKLKNGKS